MKKNAIFNSFDDKYNEDVESKERWWQCCSSGFHCSPEDKMEEAHVISLVDNATSIVMSVIFQILFFADYPNTLKTIGACLVISSMLIVGGQKFWKQTHK